MQEAKVLNVKLPFMEAIEHIAGDDENIVGAVCGKTQMYVDVNRELCVNGRKTGICVDDILSNDWFVVVGDKDNVNRNFDYVCWRCGHQLIIGNNWMASDIGMVEEDKEMTDEDFMVSSLSCPNCGAGYEVYDTPVSDRDKYNYFNEEKEE